MSNQRGEAIIKLAVWLLAVATISVPPIGALQGWFAAQRWPFRELRIDATFERVDAQQVRAAISAELERGFFATDLRGVRLAVERVPWVQAAEVRRRWPDRLEVRVLERRAVAAWHDGRVVDEDGALFQVPAATQPTGLPVLAGPEQRAVEMLGMLRAFDALLRNHGFGVARLELSGRGNWRLSTFDGAEIQLGREAVVPRLVRFLAALDQIGDSAGLQLSRADLRYANGFALQWRQLPPSLPPVKPTANPSVPQA